jgi:hypothetical protein
VEARPPALWTENRLTSHGSSARFSSTSPPKLTAARNARFGVVPTCVDRLKSVEATRLLASLACYAMRRTISAPSGIETHAKRQSRCRKLRLPPAARSPQRPRWRLLTPKPRAPSNGPLPRAKAAASACRLW